MTPATEKLRRTPILTCALLLAGAIAGSQDSALEEELNAAIRSWEVEAVTTTLARARTARAAEDTVSSRTLQIRGDLALAEMLRVEFEVTPKSDREIRRILGQRIDAAANEALQLIEGMPETSERYRIEADLLATMIRSDFRAKKHRKRLEAATRRALDLDVGNASAWVTAAKPFVFADPEQGGDLDEAGRLLDHALELDSDLEPALLLRAEVWHRQGDVEKAEAAWRAALDANPACLPALDALGAF